MKNKMFYYLLFSACSVFATEFNGIGVFDRFENLSYDFLSTFLPYNPVIVEAGTFNGDETCLAAKLWPMGKIYAFEPNPEAFENLKRSTEQFENVTPLPLALADYNGTATLYVCHGMQGNDPIFGYASSLLPLPEGMKVYCKGPSIPIPCVTLDHFCLNNQIDHIDLLKLELEGLELPVLQNATSILDRVNIVFVKTIRHPYRIDMTEYSDLKEFLEKSNFVLISHRYQPGIIGHAVFLSREFFDAFVKLSLGMYLGV